jgi:hypothetical protein
LKFLAARFITVAKQEQNSFNNSFHTETNWFTDMSERCSSMLIINGITADDVEYLSPLRYFVASANGFNGPLHISSWDHTNEIGQSRFAQMIITSSSTSVSQLITVE